MDDHLISIQRGLLNLRVGIEWASHFCEVFFCILVTNPF